MSIWWMENVNVSSLPAKIAAVPFPWWRSQSTTMAVRIAPFRRSFSMATAMSFRTQNPSP